MNLRLETEFSKADLLQEVDALKKQIDDMHPLPDDVEGRVMQKLRLDWNYHSNAIEGNRLSYGETVAFLMEGITAKGKPLKDHLDIRGHNEAINFLLSIVKDTRPISEADIRNSHQMILVEPYNVKAQTADGLPTTKRITLGEYKILPNHVKTATGETHYYATPEETPAKMQELMEWYGEASNDKDIHPVVVAALFHHKFVSIHPFDDGNGRLSRVLMNLILMQKGYPPVVIKMDDRQNYYSLLSRADNGDLWPFIEYIIERLNSSLTLYLRSANGGDIDEEEDLDKKIALFKMEVRNEANEKERTNHFNLTYIFYRDLDSLINKIILKSNEFNELFYEKEIEFFAFFADGSELTFSNSDTDTFGPLFKVANDNRKELKQLTIKFSFIEFKKVLHNFSITFSLTIFFNKNYFIITSQFEKDLIRKHYQEKITSSEKSKILEFVFENIMSSINKNLKSPKS